PRRTEAPVQAHVVEGDDAEEEVFDAEVAVAKLRSRTLRVRDDELGRVAQFDGYGLPLAMRTGRTKPTIPPD
ncbi:MAG TPA: hypothetical protein VJ787_12170, partial [Thermoleophilia bacterium]|nr:hypothetical protein [Thermoleophilia bacterium]